MVKVKGDWGGIQEGIYRVEFLFKNKKDGFVNPLDLSEDEIEYWNVEVFD